MEKNKQNSLSSKMKPVRIGLSALVLSSQLVSLSPIVQATVTEEPSSEVVETPTTEAEQPIVESVDEGDTETPEEVEEEPSAESAEEETLEETETPIEEETSEEVAEEVVEPETTETETPEPEVTEEEPQVEETQEAEEVIAEEETIPGNLLTNSSFSATEAQTGGWTGLKPENWTLWVAGNSVSQNYVAEVDENNHLLLESPTENFRASVYQDIPVTGGDTLEFSFDLKLENKVSFARVRIRENNGSQNVLDHYVTRNHSGTFDWTTFTNEFKLQPETDNIRIEIFYELGTGSAWFDNIQLVKKDVVEEPEEDILEQEITIDTQAIYLPKNADYEYVVQDSNVAAFENGFINPVSVGETTVQIFDAAGELDREIPLKVVPYEATEFDQLLETWNGIIAGNEFYNAEDPTMIAQNAALDNTVETILNDYKENANEDYLWSDVTDYSLSPSLTTSYRKIESVAKQITQPNSRFYQDAEAVRIVKDALEWLYVNVYNEDKNIIGNWWDWEIGTPRAINNTLSLMKNYFSQEENIRYTEPIEKFVPDPYYFRSTLVPAYALGGNLIDMGRVKIIEGALREDNAIISETIEALSQVFNYAAPGGEGFYEDGSYIDHTNVAYTGAYGNVLIDGLSQLIPVVLQTGFLDESKLENLYQFIDRAFLPLMYKGEMMEFTRGRSISRPEQESHFAGGEVIRGIMRIAEASEPEEQMRLYTIIKTLVVQDDYHDIFKSLQSYKDIHLMQQILDDDSIPVVERPSSLHVFNVMDKVAYHNAEKDFAIGISMYSDFTQNYEFMNDENARGYHTADGTIYFYNDDLSHYSDNYWPTVHPQFLPGTTVVLEDREDGSGQVTLESAFVGSTKLDENSATVAMDFNNWNNTLTARKSWFILGDKIVFLGADIDNESDFDAVTTVENRKLNAAETYEMYVNGEKLSLVEGETEKHEADSVLISNPNNTNMNIGYVFLEPTEVNVLQETRSGSWNEINAARPDTVYTNQFMRVYQEHENVDDTYAYVMYPNITNEELNAATDSNNIEVLQNDHQVQAVYDHELGQWGVVLYEDGAYEVEGELVLEEQGVYAISRESDHYAVSHYNPITDTTENYTVDRAEDPQEQQPTVSYQTHIQSQGWGERVENGAPSGTTGEYKRLEAIRISLADLPYEGGVEYQTHVQSDGWKDWVQDGEDSGTEGQAKRLEAIRIKLTGEMAEHYDIYYRVHAQTYGTLDWAKNGEPAGTEGLAKRLESIEIQLVEKGEPAPGSTERPYVESNPIVTYATHVEKQGWQDAVTNGEMSGTEGLGLRLEGIRLNIADPVYSGGIEYRTHVQSLGWENEWKSNGELSGTEGQALRLEAIQLKLTGQLAEKYDIYYRVHSQSFGWLDWAKNGESAGTQGLALRLEGIEVVLVEKGGEAPGETGRNFVRSNPTVNYSTHVQSIGWQRTASNGQTSGTTGRQLRLEGILMNVFTQDLTGGIEYRTHVEKEGWHDWAEDWKLSGTVGKARRLEAIQIRLTEEMAQFYDVYYRVHSETYGWLDWAVNGQPAGTEGLAKRLEGIEVRLVRKGQPAPGSTNRPFVMK